MMRKLKTVLLLLGVLVAPVACNDHTPTPPISTSAPRPTAMPPTPSIPPCDTSLVRVAYYASPTLKPFVYEEQGESVGFVLKLMDAIALTGGFQIESYEEVPLLPNVLPRLTSGEFDVGIRHLPLNPGSEYNLDFSLPYYRSQRILAVQSGSGIQGPENVNTVGVADPESTRWVESNLHHVELEEFDDEVAALRALDRGQLDAVVCDRARAEQAIQDNFLDHVDLLLDNPLEEERYAIALRPGCPELKERIDSALAQLIESSQCSSICAEWTDEENFHAQYCCPPVEVMSTPSPTRTTPPETQTPPSTPELTPSDILDWEGEAYTVAPGDWLSKIAQREYDNAVDYRAIVSYTNQRAEEAGTELDRIDNPNVIDVGMRIYLPSQNEIARYWDRQLFAGLPPFDPTAVEGDILAVGSSTVYPLTRRIGDEFEAVVQSSEVDVEPPGTRVGFRRFCVDGDPIDIVDASDPVEEEEREACRQIGRGELIELQIATDALPIVVNAQNDFIGDRSLTLEQLRLIFAEAVYWSDVDPEWPDEPIYRFIPGKESGTFSYFVDAVFDGDEDPPLSASNVTTSGDDDVLVMGIENQPYAVGFFGYAYYLEHTDTLRALVVEGVEPRQESVDDESYLLLRPLFIYTTPEIVNGEPQVAAFINFYLRNVKDVVIDVGYFMPDQDDFEVGVERFTRALER